MNFLRQRPGAERSSARAQIRRSSNSSPANLAEKVLLGNAHVRNKIEGVNRARNEALETIHHLFIAQLKRYETERVYRNYRQRYEECVRMLNGLEKRLETQLPESERRWPANDSDGSKSET